MKKIPLTQGKVALVDDEDFGLVSAYKWHVLAGSCSNYARCRQGSGRDHIRILMHRFLMNPGEGLEVDHVNSDGLDNRRANLRICTHRQNHQNRRKQRHMRGKLCSSGFKGATWDKPHRCWRAQIYHKGKRIYLGLFHNERDAALAYDAKAKQLFGEFALLNLSYQG